MSKHLFTSESVFEGHPDKMADQISDAVLDAILEQDKEARSGCETFVNTGLVIVGGEITTSCYVDIHEIVRNTIRDIGYTDPEYGFDHRTCAVLNAIDKQSPDIAMGVDKGGAGDQGLMVGFACKETEELMPLPIMLAHTVSRKAAAIRRDKGMSYLRPDGKTQITVEYEDGKPKRIETVVVSLQHDDGIEHKQIEEETIKHIVEPAIGEYLDKDTKYFINPTGRFVIGGPVADAGMTGRKIIVDSYGGYVAVGGGAFSGKEPMKVDRSAAYMARYIAKNLVAADLADKCEVHLAYAIGVADPVSVFVDTYGTGKVSDEQFTKTIREVFPLTPLGMIEGLDLLRPIYKKTACYGHFGRTEPEFKWEKTDKIEEIKKSI